MLLPQLRVALVDVVYLIVGQVHVLRDLGLKIALKLIFHAFMELVNLTDLISVNVLVELLMLPPVLVQLILDVLDVLADVVMGLIRRLLEAGQLLLQPLVHLVIINVII